MKSDVTRRDFMKVAGVGAGVAVAAGYSPFSYAANEKVKVACIGTGGQGGFHIRYGLAESDDIEIVAVCDWYQPHQNAAWEAAGGKEREVKKYYDYRKLLDEVEFDAAVIATPLHQHHHIAMDCLDAGKHIFLEKTMCQTLEQCRDIVKKRHETGKIVQVGHQRRYNPEYNKAVWLARGDSGENRPSMTGRINHIQAHWHRNNDWRRGVPSDYELNEEEKKFIKTDLEHHLNWRLYEESSGGLITELATHHTDVMSWFLGTMPTKVKAYGGIDYWKDTREVPDNITLIYEWDVAPQDDGFQVIPPRNDFQRPRDINRKYTVRTTWSSICANARKGYGMEVMGDRGGFVLTEQQGCTYFPEAAAQENWNERAEAKQDAAEAGADIVGGKSRELPSGAYKDGVPIKVVDDRGEVYTGGTAVDRVQFARFAKDIREGGTPKANEIVGLHTAVCGFAALEAMESGCEVEITKDMYTFDFETPDPFQYEYFGEPEDA